MIKNFALVFLASFAISQILTPLNSITTKATVVKVTDGDTIRVEICKTFSVRLVDCWAPELDSKDQVEKAKAQEAKKFLEDTLKKATDVSVTIPLNDDIIKSFTFGRLLGIVHAKIDDKWVNVNQLLVEKGFATKEKE